MFIRIVEEKILEGIREGQFDNLRGKGKPLVWDENAFEKEEMRLANHILKENGVLPEWLGKKQEIETETIIIRKMIWENQETFLIKEKISRLNHKILDYNLLAPLPALQVPFLVYENEQAKIIESNKPIDGQDI